jgi:hypothetical protein
MLWLSEKFATFLLPFLDPSIVVGNADVHKTGGLVRVCGVCKTTVGLSSVGPPPTFTMIQLLAS